MSQLLAITPTGTQELDSRTSAEILLHAVASGAKVRVEPEDASAGACTGHLTDGDEETLLFHRSKTLSGAEPLPTSVLLIVSMTLEGRRYEFLSRWVEAPASPDSPVRITRPDRVAVVERRRSRRRFVADTTVTLMTMAETEPLRCRATLLNLSADGVACLASEDDCRGFEENEVLRVRFAVGSPLLTFTLTGRLVNRTGAGTPGQVVLGLEFTDDEGCRLERDRLRRAIKTAARFRTSD
jgi:hypothetical protein